MTITELLPPSEEFFISYQENIKIGKKFIQSKKIVIVGLARNIEHKIEHSIQRLVRIGESAQEYKIIIFENDSEDNTKSILENLSSTNSNIITIHDKYNRPQFGPVQDRDRINALAEYRNILKEYVRNELPDYDFVIVSDMDFIDFSDDGCYNSFGWLMQNETIGGICGNSFEYKNLFGSETFSLWNYDSWAYRGSWWNNLQTSNNAQINFDPMIWFGLQILPIGSAPFRINSGFGGMAIYRNHFFIDGNYSGQDCEHVMFHYDIKQKYPDFHLFLNPSQRMLV